MACILSYSAIQRFSVEFWEYFHGAEYFVAGNFAVFQLDSAFEKKIIWIESAFSFVSTHASILVRASCLAIGGGEDG